jgi:hypothetical protein
MTRVLAFTAPTSRPESADRGVKLGAVLSDGYYRKGGRSVNKIAPFLWFNDNPEDALRSSISRYLLKNIGKIESNVASAPPYAKAIQPI